MSGPGWKPATEPTLRMRPVLALEHAGEDEAGEFGERGDVDLDHAEHLREVGVGEGAEVAEAGVVDEHVDREPGRSAPPRRATRRGGIGEVRGEDVARRRRELGGQARSSASRRAVRTRSWSRARMRAISRPIPALRR